MPRGTCTSCIAHCDGLWQLPRHPHTRGLHIADLTTSDKTNLVDAVLVSDGESSDKESMCLTNEDENAGLQPINEVTYSDLWGVSESSTESKADTTQSEAPAAIFFHQVMMIEPTTSVLPMATTAGSSTSSTPVSGPMAFTTQPSRRSKRAS